MELTEEQKRLGHEFHELVDNWIKEHNLSCSNCANRTDKNKDKCTLKCYCIVKYGYGIMGYTPIE